MSGFSPTTSFFVFFLPLNSSYYSHEYFQIISYTHSYSIGMTDFRICNKWYVHVAFLLWNKCLCLPSLQNSYAEAQYPNKVETLGSPYVEMSSEGAASVVGSAPLWGEEDRGPSLHQGGPKTATWGQKEALHQKQTVRAPQSCQPPAPGGGSPSLGSSVTSAQLTAALSSPRFLNTQGSGSHTVYLRLFCLNWQKRCYYWLVTLVIKVFVQFFTITGSKYI